MISRETIRAAHEELGRPTDKETIHAAFEEANEAACERCDDHFYRLIAQWRQENGDNPWIPGEVTGRCHAQAMRLAEEEILEEWYNEPIRALIDSRVEAGEDGW
ncbi:hypothetical protein KBX17_02420 [Corynebacterium sp. CCUG 65737]|uniref:hypothetical protein n=1 Tax=Corynebacterium sp. CCUG 65737 TaxID=2823889 RepID=UPI002108B7DD|nr:hypothetical protein [Corynebacterium sp. CCUG 65737]MCQ4626673.1 hypothetical protein [Corynebacterium sp. CCUG 65737]